MSIATEACRLWLRALPAFVKWLFLPGVPLVFLAIQLEKAHQPATSNVLMYLGAIFLVAVSSRITHAHFIQAPIANPYAEVVPRLAPLVGFWILYTVTVVAGLLLFVLPGLIWSATLSWGDDLVLGYRLSPRQALQMNWQVLKGRWGRVLLFQCGVWLLISLLIIACFVLTVVSALLLGLFLKLPDAVREVFAVGYVTMLTVAGYGFWDSLEKTYLYRLLQEEPQLKVQLEALAQSRS